MFVRDDAFAFLARNSGHFDAVHASPPCQRYSRGSKQSHTGHLHPDLIAPTREALRATGLPWIIENVADARRELIDPIMLCGGMFPGLRTYRHRLFESNFPLVAPPHEKHVVKTPRSNVYIEGMFMAVYGHVTPVHKAREVMGIDWPMTQSEITEAIPPAYTEHLGRQLMVEIERRSSLDRVA